MKLTSIPYASLLLGTVFLVQAAAIGGAGATIINGSFESANYDGWSRNGSTGIFQNLGGVHRAPHGQFYVLLHAEGSTGSTMENVIGIPLGSIRSLMVEGRFSPSVGGSMQQTFVAQAGQKVTFFWNFLSNESPTVAEVDMAFAALVTPSTYSLTRLSDTRGNDVPIDPSIPPVNFGGALIDNGATGFQTGMFVVPESGAVTLAFGVINDGSTDEDSSLLIDGVALLPASVPEPGAIALFAMGLTVVFAVRRRQAVRAE